MKGHVGRNRLREGNESSLPVATILFIAANPLQVHSLQLNEECRAIERVLASSRFRDQVRFRACWAVRLDDVVQALNDDAPTVLHFGGHGYGAQGICLQAEHGNPEIVSTDELVEIIPAAGESVTTVVLNACYTDVQARALARHVPCVVGTSGAIEDGAAIEYSRWLYRALASGRSVANAHSQGAAAFKRCGANGVLRDVAAAENALHVNVPRLLTRSDIDPDRVYIAGPETLLRYAYHRNKSESEEQVARP